MVERPCGTRGHSAFTALHKMITTELDQQANAEEQGGVRCLEEIGLGPSAKVP